MASAFIGLTVKVLLTSGTSLKGHVANVDPNTQRLMLQDGKQDLIHHSLVPLGHDVSLSS